MGVMDRLVLSDAAWERMAPLIIGRPDQKGSTGRDNRMFVEGVLWIVRCSAVGLHFGCPVCSKIVSVQEGASPATVPNNTPFSRFPRQA